MTPQPSLSPVHPHLQEGSKHKQREIPGGRQRALTWDSSVPSCCWTWAQTHHGAASGVTSAGDPGVWEPAVCPRCLLEDVKGGGVTHTILSHWPEDFKVFILSRGRWRKDRGGGMRGCCRARLLPWEIPSEAWAWRGCFGAKPLKTPIPRLLL